jgi:hypothetical protein
LKFCIQRRRVGPDPLIFVVREHHRPRASPCQIKPAAGAENMKSSYRQTFCSAITAAIGPVARASYTWISATDWRMMLSFVEVGTA